VEASNLPTFPAPFVGRHDELTDIVRLLSDPACRLLTLVGPGGIGKTRLALEAARQLTFPNGVHLILLQPLSSSDFIIPAIAEAMNIQLQSNTDPKQQLMDYFHEKSPLVILDNFEHLMDGVEIVSDVLAHAPGVKMLTTSRERLNLLEEWVMEIQGLAFPASETESEIEDYSAIQLFLQNARRVQVGFALTDAQKPAITRICQMVDGMPLGIELASAWVRALSCEQIAAELEHSADILETSARNMPSRHRNMRAVFEPTWDRLSEEERGVFTALSVFRGGFTREAAEQVAGASLRTLTTFVDKSLLRIDANGRCDIHELLRQYAEEQLEASGEANTTRDVHMNYCAHFMRQRQSHVRGRRQLAVLDEIEADFDNVRVAWLRAVQKKHADAVSDFLETLMSFCVIRGRFQEGEELFRRAQEWFTPGSTDQLPLIWRRIATYRSRLQVLGALIPQADVQAEIEQCLAIARTHGDQADMAMCLWLLGIIAFSRGNCDSAIVFFEDSLAYYRALDDRDYIGHLLCWIANCQADADGATKFYQQSLEILRDVGDIEGMAWALRDMGTAKLFVNQLVEAEACFQESLVNHQAVRDRQGIIWSMGALSECAFFGGEFERAAALAEDTLTRVIEFNLLPNKMIALSTLGVVSIVLAGDPVRGRRLCEEALALPDTVEGWFSLFVARMGIALSAFAEGEYQIARQHFQTLLKLAMATSNRPLSLATCLPVGALMRAHEGEKQRAVELLGLAFTHPMSATGWLEKCPLLTRVRAQLEAELGVEAYAMAWERGKVLELEPVLARLLEENEVQELQNPSYVRTRDANQALLEPLSERELEVLQLIAAGLSNSEIAERLFVGVSTVKTHINHIYSKLSVTNRTQALVRATEWKLL
jgi:predicted ATPase/DNA-binding CsgD family transcriptional regulator